MTEIELLRETLIISGIALAVSIVVSAATITFGILNMAFQRSHNIRSVRPLCNIHTVIKDDFISISIFNAGLGPMKIRQTGFIKSGIKPGKDAQSLHDLLPRDISYSVLVTESEDYTVAQLSEMKLVEFSAQNEIERRSVQKIREIIREHSIVVRYRDIYDREYIKVS
jgi:meiotically up-regulated gene 157 (Mug157) protein